VLEQNIRRAVEDIDDSYTPDCDGDSGPPSETLYRCAMLWKVASVTPILKSGPKKNNVNYRPIA